MKPRFSNQRNHALTLVEVLVVIVVLAVLVVLAILHVNNEDNWRRKALQINCVNNLKEISLAYRIWAGDNNGKFPFEISVTNGGSMELAATGDVVTTFQIVSNELTTPKLLICPGDIERFPPAKNFITQLVGKISYFVGLNASANFPQSLFSGDDNFAIGGVPVKSGLLELSTNTPVLWTSARHHFAGNIGLADGSVWQVTQNGLRQTLQKTGSATNRLAIP
jgi:prepilin-type N-terminal cleavage/methylation domain-containing protein